MFEFVGVAIFNGVELFLFKKKIKYVVVLSRKIFWLLF